MTAAILEEHPHPARQASPVAPESVPAPSDEGRDSDPYDHSATSRKIRELPKDVGVMLMAVGACGMVLPGMVGGPAMIAGGLVLWPSAFGRVETWFGRKFPKTHREGMKQIGRYLDDLDRRYAYSQNDAPKAADAETPGIQIPRSEAP